MLSIRIPKESLDRFSYELVEDTAKVCGPPSWAIETLNFRSERVKEKKRTSEIDVRCKAGTKCYTCTVTTCYATVQLHSLYSMHVNDSEFCISPVS